MKVKIKTTESPLPSKSLDQGIKKKNKKKKTLQNTPAILTAVKESTFEVQPTAIAKKKKKKKKSVNDHSDVAMGDASSTTSPITKDEEMTVTKRKGKKGRAAGTDVTNNGAIKKMSEEDPSLNREPSTKQKKKGPKKIKKGKESRQEQEERTVFVGNVHINSTRLDLSRFFSKYGKIETVRLRSAAVASPEMSKKESINTGKFHEKRTSLNAYVRFTQKEMVEEALEANGVEFMEKHLNVDKAVGGRDHNETNAVFVGNLTFEAEEELLRAHFADCGEIESVRIIRSKSLGSGKGFGYVNFKSADSVEIALRLDNYRFMHRQLRVQRCEKRPKKAKAPKKVVKKVPGKMELGSLKYNKDNKKKQTKKKAGGSFSGVKMVETKTFKKMKKKKGKLTKAEWKKKAIAHQLTGAKPKVKKTT